MKRPNKEVYSLEENTRRLIVNDPFLNTRAISKYGKGSIVKVNNVKHILNGQLVKIVRIMDKVDYSTKELRFEYMIKSLPGNGDMTLSRVREDELLTAIDSDSELLTEDIAYVNAHIKLSIKKEFEKEFENMEGYNINRLFDKDFKDKILSAYAENIEIYYDKDEDVD